MTGEIYKHVVFVSAPAMSIPLLPVSIIQLLIKFSGLFVSFYMAQSLVPECETYLAKFHPTVTHRVRIVAAPIDLIPRDFIANLINLEKAFGPWIIEQYSQGRCEIKGLNIEPPCSIVEDHITGGISLASKQHHKLPIVALSVPSATWFLLLLGEKDTDDDTQATLAKESGNSQFLPESASVRLVSNPGLPPFYEHERVTQDLSGMQSIIALVTSRIIRMLDHIDKIGFLGLNEMAPVAIKTCATASSRRLDVYSLGLAADLPNPKTQGMIDHDTSDPVLQFMNRAYSELGPHSVIYISFGTVIFLPAESAVYLRAVIDEILAQGLRLVFSVKPQYAQIAGMDEEYTNKLAEAGHAVFPEWVQQLDVLEHPAIHYFLSHGGWNSVTEAIVRGVPMIFWPTVADGPVNAIHMTRQHDCGFELLQVRTGAAKSVAYTDHGDVPIVGSADAVRAEIRRILALTKGERGDQQRRNMKTLGQVAVSATEAGGSADVEVERLGREIGL